MLTTMSLNMKCLPLRRPLLTIESSKLVCFTVSLQAFPSTQCCSGGVRSKVALHALTCINLMRNRHRFESYFMCPTCILFCPEYVLVLTP